MKAGFVLIGGLILLLYLASKKVTTQTSVNLNYNPPATPAASQLDSFLSAQSLGTATLKTSFPDDETAWANL